MLLLGEPSCFLVVVRLPNVLADVAGARRGELEALRCLVGIGPTCEYCLLVISTGIRNDYVTKGDP